MKTFLLIVASGLALCSFGQSEINDVATRSLTFQPDHTLSNASEWKRIGAGEWRSENEEIVGDGAGGLLMSERSFQDVAVNVQFKCTPGSEAGIVFRLEKNGDGWKGVLVSIKDGEIADFRIAFDANGKELKREELKAAGGNNLARMAPTPPADAPAARSGGRGGAFRGRRGGDSNSPLKRPDTTYRSNDWNQVEIFLDLNVVRCFFNDGNQTAVGVADENAGNYGAIALFAGGAGEVRFKEVAYKDLSARALPAEKISPRFRMQRVSDMYYSWGAAAADFNKDGAMDIVAGPYIYFGPEFTNYREIYPAVSFNPAEDFAEVNCEYAFDFTGDGWPDVLTGPPNATLYVNPKGESRRWDKFVVVPGIQSEVTVLKDIDGSGVPALIYAKGGAMYYAKPDPANPTKFIEHAISEPGYALAHGIGVGDINGDGRMDIANPNGWWEQPATYADKSLWTYHPQAFGRYAHRASNAGGAVMAIYDVNGDGLNDVVTSLNAHGFGLAWFEQKRDAAGNISFVRHMISDDYSAKNAGNVTFSQPHGSTFADVDGDGIPDFIVGKRYWSHLDVYFDPDPYGPPVLYWYRTVRNPRAPGGAEFIPELIHNRSGAGSDVTAVDLNHDGKVDIITSTDRGTFIFWNTGNQKVTLQIEVGGEDRNRTFCDSTKIIRLQ
jgi:hypothetical protein